MGSQAWQDGLGEFRTGCTLTGSNLPRREAWRLAAAIPFWSCGSVHHPSVRLRAECFQPVDQGQLEFAATEQNHPKIRRLELPGNQPTETTHGPSSRRSLQARRILSRSAPDLRRASKGRMASLSSDKLKKRRPRKAARICRWTICTPVSTLALSPRIAASATPSASTVARCLSSVSSAKAAWKSSRQRPKVTGPP
jgi:hypothetical protein